jgi:hypothetical protein
MKTVMKTFMIGEKSRNLAAVQPPLSGLHDERTESFAW